MRWTQRVLVCVLALLVLLPAAVVYAHADLIGSEPTDGAVLDRAPKQVRLFFSEPIEREFFALEVYTQDRVRVDRRDAHIPPDNAAALEASLGALAPGTYTVVWRVLSIDGHVVRGAYAFSVGAASGAAPRLDFAAGGTPFALGAMVRWWTFFFAFVLVGGLGFVPLVLAPAARAAGIAEPAAERQAGRRFVWTAWPALVLLFGLSLAALVFQAADATGVPLAEVLQGRAITRLLSGTKYGTLWLARMGLLLGLLAVVAAATALGRPRRGLSWAGLALGAGLLLTISASGHASAVPERTALAIGADWLHLVAGAVWVGGLVQLVLALPPVLRVLEPTGRRTLLGHAIRRFSWVAGLSVAALTLTGLYAGLIHVPSWQAMLDTVYGAALSGKLMLIAGLIALGAINLLVLHPRFRRGMAARPGTPEDTGGQRLFHLVVRAEVILAVLVLLVSGMLSGLPPATTEAGAGQPFTATQEVADLRVTLAVTPNQAGTNQVQLTLTDRGGQPVPEAEVAVRLHHREMEMGEREVRPEPAEAGSFQASGNFLSMTGDWQADVAVRRPGQPEQTTSFQFAVGQAPGNTGPVFSPARVLWNALTPITAAGVTALGLAGLIFLQRGRRRNGRARRQAVWLGSALLVAGAFGTAIGITSAYRATRPNPQPATAASIAEGRQIYVQNCASCHGISGRGDGPAGIMLRPRPADFRAHMAAGHTDPQLYGWVREGVDGTAMPAFGDKLSEEEIWHVVNFIRTFAPGGSTSQP